MFHKSITSNHSIITIGYVTSIINTTGVICRDPSQWVSYHYTVEMSAPSFDDYKHLVDPSKNTSPFKQYDYMEFTEQIGSYTYRINRGQIIDYVGLITSNE